MIGCHKDLYVRIQICFAYLCSRHRYCVKLIASAPYLSLFEKSS